MAGPSRFPVERSDVGTRYRLVEAESCAMRASPGWIRTPVPPGWLERVESPECLRVGCIGTMLLDKPPHGLWGTGRGAARA